MESWDVPAERPALAPRLGETITMPSIHLRPPWTDLRIAPTPEHVFLNRRDWMRLAGCGTAALLFGCGKQSSAEPALPQIADQPPPDDVRALYPAQRSAKYKVQRALTAEKVAARYNNFYEFTTDKERVADLVGSFVIRPWEVEIGGLVNKPIRIDVDDLVRKMGLEERVYRFRCVEAWAMTVPWTGFPMKKLIDHVEPLGTSPLCARRSNPSVRLRPTTARWSNMRATVFSAPR